jgi:uncharacterized protein YegJ (DUF2314 family)
MESQENIFYTCGKHSSRPQTKYLTWDPSRFVGNFIKMCFQEIGTGKKEHLWVRINSIKDKETLYGIVDNDPVLNLEVKDGDPVEVPIKEIELFFDGVKQE